MADRKNGNASFERLMNIILPPTDIEPGPFVQPSHLDTIRAEPGISDSPVEVQKPLDSKQAAELLEKAVRSAVQRDQLSHLALSRDTEAVEGKGRGNLDEFYMNMPATRANMVEMRKVFLEKPDEVTPQRVTISRGLKATTKKMRGARGGKKHRKGKKGMRHPRLPPQLETVITVGHTYRYQALNACNSVNVTVGNVAGACMMVGTVLNSTCVAPVSSVKVRRVKLWPSATTGLNPNNNEIIWQYVGSNFEKDESKSDVLPTGVTIDECLVATPPKKSFACLWSTMGNASNVLFQVTCAAGAVVDVDVAFTLANNFGGLTITGFGNVVVGTVYYGRLDGVNGKLIPQGVPTTN
jgi:hypothetical protein